MREKIIHKSAELFLNLGFKSVTMDDIANELAISKKTIYTHFPNKTALVQAATFEVFSNVCCGIDAICEQSENPIKVLYDIKVFMMQQMCSEKASPQFQLKKYYPKIFEELQSKQFEKMYQSVKTSLEEGIETGLFRSNINPDFIARIYFNSMSGIKNEDLFPRELYTMEYLIESYLEYHLRAIVTDKGFNILNKFINTNN